MTTKFISKQARLNTTKSVLVELVLVGSVETEEDEGPEVSLNDILEMSISNFTALRCSISNYTHFREEARQLMLNVYHRLEVGVHGMDKSLMSSLPAWPMITSEVPIYELLFVCQLLAMKTLNVIGEF